jgi:hypothetical protein
MRFTVLVALLAGSALAAPVVRRYGSNDDIDDNSLARRYTLTNYHALATRTSDSHSSWLNRRSGEGPGEVNLDHAETYEGSDGEEYYRQAGEVAHVKPKDLQPPTRRRKNTGTQVSIK